ncbi:MAG: hypothetical protein U1E76_13060 [Planctomycetota bacterium]
MRSPSLTGILVSLGILVFPATALASGETITVTTLHDVRDFGGGQRVADLPGPDGKVSFGEAVAAANNEPGPQTIVFAIPRSEYWLITSIALLELEIGPFVLVDDDTTIDFRTQTDFAGDTNPNGWEVGIYGLEPNGWGIAAIFVDGDNCTLIGLDDVLQRGYAVEVVGRSNHIQSFTTDGPLYAAIHVEGVFGGAAATANVIGGALPGEGNIVSGGNSGIRITGPADDNIVIGNTCLGSPAAGIEVVAATQYGVFARRNRIGGSAAGERNWVAGNGSYGEEGFPGGTQVSLIDVDDTIVEGNYVGTTADGMADYPVASGTAGIGMRAARGTIVRDNLVSGMVQVGVNHYQGQRFGVGIFVQGVCADTSITGNLVGTDALGQAAIPNLAGISVVPFLAPDLPIRTTIGGTGADQGNTIAFNERTGLIVDGLVGSVAIRGNQFFDNGALGIDLFTYSGGGVTPNDQDDVDNQGGNHLQNFPLVNHAIAVGPALYVTGTFNSTPAKGFALDFFASPAADPTGYGEGTFYLGSIDVVTSSSGDTSFEAVLAKPVPVGFMVTATATRLDLGETSEFSPATRVSDAMPRRLPWGPKRQ